MRSLRTLSSLLFCLALLRPGLPLAGPIDHRAAFSRLPPEPELLYLPERFAPCLSCHPKALAEDEDFNVDTRFRDTGLGKNLHWIHVFRQPQGTNCTACHRSDAAEGPVSFPPGIRIERTPQGGSCAPVCHRPKEYRNAGGGR
ncbi:MAG: hypothetical protein OHK0028_00810 [Deltaproteobacteria bacterium]